MAGAPSSMAPSLAVVPPMSKVMTCSRPSALPTMAHMRMPAAGPDSMMRTGKSRARSGEISPPLDCITNSSLRMPRAAQRLVQMAQVAIDDWLDVGIGDGGVGALVLAELRRDLRGDRHRECRGARGDAARGCAARARGWHRRAAAQTATVSRPDSSMASMARSTDASSSGVTTEPSGADALDHLDDMAPLHERLRLVDVEIVGLVALLATDDEHVAEALRGDEAGGCALALEHRVGGDRRRMQHHVDGRACARPSPQAASPAPRSRPRRGRARWSAPSGHASPRLRRRAARNP